MTKRIIIPHKRKQKRHCKQDFEIGSRVAWNGYPTHPWAEEARPNFQTMNSFSQIKFPLLGRSVAEDYFIHWSQIFPPILDFVFKKRSHLGVLRGIKWSLIYWKNIF